ncbi:MAG: hypothetical protein JXA94_01015 [Parachlamydiales bacterium]|nr:hypothetical protein [Parachlamydiales bacterium]
MNFIDSLKKKSEINFLIHSASNFEKLFNFVETSTPKITISAQKILSWGNNTISFDEVINAASNLDCTDNHFFMGHFYRIYSSKQRYFGKKLQEKLKKLNTQYDLAIKKSNSIITIIFSWIRYFFSVLNFKNKTNFFLTNGLVRVNYYTKEEFQKEFPINFLKKKPDEYLHGLEPLYLPPKRANNLVIRLLNFIGFRKRTYLITGLAAAIFLYNKNKNPFL